MNGWQSGATRGISGWGSVPLVATLVAAQRQRWWWIGLQVLRDRAGEIAAEIVAGTHQCFTAAEIPPFAFTILLHFLQTPLTIRNARSCTLNSRCHGAQPWHDTRALH